MTKHPRRAAAPFDGPEHRGARGPNGRGLCRWCGTEVTGRRETWCSDECVDIYKALQSTGAAVRYLLERDGDRCEVCGIEGLVEAHGSVNSLFQGLRHRLELWDANHWVHDQAGWRAQVAFWDLFRQHFADLGGQAFALPEIVLGIGRLATKKYIPAFAEVDHRIPLIEGGPHALENLRLVCRPCHLALTAALAKRRAQARRRGP